MKSGGHGGSGSDNSANKQMALGRDLLLKAVVMNAPCGCVITDCAQDNKVTFVNRAFAGITGYQASEVIGRSCYFWLGEDTVQDGLVELKDAIESKRHYTEVLKNYRKNGSLFYNELTVMPIVDQFGRVAHLLWYLHDVSPYKKVEGDLYEKIAGKDERFSAYTRNSNEALWRLDFSPSIPLDIPEEEQVQAVFDRGVYTEANDTTARIYGLSQGRDLRGQPVSKYLPKSNPENISKITELVSKRFHMKRVITRETRVDGGDIVALNNIVPAFSDNRVTHMWGASLDVTELIDAQKYLQQSKDELAAQKKALEEKNIVLKELIAFIEMEKKAFTDRVRENIEEIALPSLERIRLNRGSEFYIEQHRKNLETLTSSYGENINKIRVKLTPRELEVCNLVKNGHSNKDIARLLSIAQHTVEKHRRMARKKLGLTNQQINLHAYLNSL